LSIPFYDGHGSVRNLANSTGSLLEDYHFGGYGWLLSNSDSPSVDVLYAGQVYDFDMDFYNNWNRWYDPYTGRFNRVDLFEGNFEDPISLHKYLYCHNNPINGLDPTGYFTQSFGYLAEAAIQDVYASDHKGDIVLYGRWTRFGGPHSEAYKLKPDILNMSPKKKSWLEIKPLSISGVASSATQYAKYNALFLPFGYSPEVSWTPSKHFVYAGQVQICFFNAGGIVFYTDLVDLFEDLAILASVQAVRGFIASRGGLFIARSLVNVGSRIPALVRARISIDTNRLRTHSSIALTISCFLGF